MNAEQALEIARAAWGVGARVTLVAIGKTDVPEEVREQARRDLVAHEANAPKLLQTDSAPPDMTIREYEYHRRAWHEAYRKHSKREGELRELAYGFLMVVERPGFGFASPLRETFTWEDALKSAGLNGRHLIGERVAKDGGSE